MGVLFDLSGNDDYACLMQCQAFSANNGVSLLWDSLGADDFSMAGLQGQGYSKDAGAIAVLLDSDGGDSYQAPGAAQGMAQGASIGVLFDVGGQDTYQTVTANARASSLATGNALFLDLAGTDTYLGPSPGANDATWGPGLTPPTYKRGKDCETGPDPLGCLAGLP